MSSVDRERHRLGSQPFFLFPVTVVALPVALPLALLAGHASQPCNLCIARRQLPLQVGYLALFVPKTTGENRRGVSVALST